MTIKREIERARSIAIAEAIHATGNVRQLAAFSDIFGKVAASVLCEDGMSVTLENGTELRAIAEIASATVTDFLDGTRYAQAHHVLYESIQNRLPFKHRSRLASGIRDAAQFIVLDAVLTGIALAIARGLSQRPVARSTKNAGHR